LILTFLYDYVAEYRDFLAHLRGLRFREGEQVKKYLKSPEGSRPKGHVIPMDRERKIKTYKGAVVKHKAINRDFHSSSLASGNLSEDNMVRGRVETILQELDQVKPSPESMYYGRTTDFQSPPNYNSSSNSGQNRVVSFGDNSLNRLNQMNFDNGPYRAYFNSGFNNGKF